MGRPQTYNSEEERRAARKAYRAAYYKKQKEAGVKYSKSKVVKNAIERIMRQPKYQHQMLDAIGIDTIKAYMSSIE